MAGKALAVVREDVSSADHADEFHVAVEHGDAPQLPRPEQRDHVGYGVALLDADHFPREHLADPLVDVGLDEQVRLGEDPLEVVALVDDRQRGDALFEEQFEDVPAGRLPRMVITWRFMISRMGTARLLR